MAHNLPIRRLIFHATSQVKLLALSGPADGISKMSACDPGYLMRVAQIVLYVGVRGQSSGHAHFSLTSSFQREDSEKFEVVHYYILLQIESGFG